jgi:protein-tyrosine-phosphatase
MVTSHLSDNLQMDSPAPPPHRNVLFVCTGNTCRSPLAEAICKRLLADRLGCQPGELPTHGFVVQSAGVMAYAGDLASPLAVDVATALQADLAHHRSRPVNPELLLDATDVIAMTQAHIASLEFRFPNLGPKPQILCDAVDLPDPIGGDIDEYRACARLITVHLNRYIRGWLGS